ncbi:hypothetical protein D3C87_992920 [compost metagenome]
MAFVVCKSSTDPSVVLYYEGVDVSTRRVVWTADQDQAKRMTKASAEYVCDRYQIMDYTVKEEDDGSHTS